MTDQPTYLAFQYDGSLTTLSTTVVDTFPASSLEESDKPLFKDFKEDDFIVVTKETIYHPQGGGQPSDIGTIKSEDSSTTFTVRSARTSISKPGVVLHLGRYEQNDLKPVDAAASTSTPPINKPSAFSPTFQVTQTIDIQQRLLFSRYHTAGHILGASVRHLLETTIPNFDELKASHVPGSASCEFLGSIPSTHLPAIQAQLNKYLAADLPVEIDWWDVDEFRRNGLERLVKDLDEKMLGPGETKFRVVKIVGAEVYPCGGTHVGSTGQCGKTTAKKIGRSKGTSKVSYFLD